MIARSFCSAFIAFCVFSMAAAVPQQHPFYKPYAQYYHDDDRFATFEVDPDDHGERADAPLTVLPPEASAAKLNPKITTNDTDVCVMVIGITLCFKKSQIADEVCGTRVGNIATIGCRIKDEDNYLGLCYKKCSLLTGAKYPLRTATNTCAKNGCAPTEELDAGLCYPKCKDYFIGHGPVCWGRCVHFCGKDHSDVGLYCYRWWPPHSCTKPSYGRGVGTAPNSPWTKGLGCNGFGVNGDGGCALIDIKIPFFGCP